MISATVTALHAISRSSSAHPLRGQRPTARQGEAHRGAAQERPRRRDGRRWHQRCPGAGCGRCRHRDGLGHGHRNARRWGDVAALDPRLVSTAIEISRATVRKIRQNLFWAFIYNIVGIPLAALGVLTPVFAGRRWHCPACQSSAMHCC